MQPAFIPWIEGCLLDDHINDCQGQESDIEINEQFLEHQPFVVPAGHQGLAASGRVVKKRLAMRNRTMIFCSVERHSVKQNIEVGGVLSRPFLRR